MSGGSTAESDHSERIPAPVRRLTAILKKSGPRVRRIIYYDADHATQLYIRDDAKGHVSRDEFDRLITDLRLDAFARRQQENVYRRGNLHCVLRAFDEAFELNLIISETQGVMVTFDPDDAATPGSFIERCIEILDGRPR